MRAIKIDPRTRTIEAIDTPANLDDLYRLIETDIVEAVNLGRKQMLWIDEEGLLRKEVKPFFSFVGYEDKPLCGVGVILGVDDDGDNIDTTLSVPDIFARIVWLDDIEYVGMEQSEDTVDIGGKEFARLNNKPIFRKKGEPLQ